MPAAPAAAPAPAKEASNIPPLNENNIVSIAVGSEDHTTLVAAIKARHADLAVSVSAYPERHPQSPTDGHDLDVLAAKGMRYDFLFVAKGGGSANKTFLYQGTPSLLTPDRLMDFLKEKIQGNKTLEAVNEFFHFACTSEDINNLSHALMLKEGITREWIPLAKDMLDKLGVIAEESKDISMLARTHGQAATPTTIGKGFCHES